MSFDKLRGERVFLQKYLAERGWGGLLKKLDMVIEEDNNQEHLPSVGRFLISQARLGIIVADSQLMVDRLSIQRRQEWV